MGADRPEVFKLRAKIARARVPARAGANAVRKPANILARAERIFEIVLAGCQKRFSTFCCLSVRILGVSRIKKTN
jgi:hypothetical protein